MRRVYKSVAVDDLRRKRISAFETPSRVLVDQSAERCTGVWQAVRLIYAAVISVEIAPLGSPARVDRAPLIAGRPSHPEGRQSAHINPEIAP